MAIMAMTTRRSMRVKARYFIAQVSPPPRRTPCGNMPPARLFSFVAALLIAAAGPALLVTRAVHRGFTPQELARQRAATPAGMVFVPGGPFLMGTDDPDADEDARPRHSITLSSFYIGRTEVTN